MSKHPQEFALSPFEEEVVRIFERHTRRKGEVVLPQHLVQNHSPDFTNKEIADGVEGLMNKGLVEETANGHFRRLWLGPYEQAA